MRAGVYAVTGSFLAYVHGKTTTQSCTFYAGTQQTGHVYHVETPKLV